MKTQTLSILIFCVLLVSKICAQCPTSGYILMQSQSEIDNFPTNYPGCTNVPSAVIVVVHQANYGPISNLNGLGQIKTIAGDLHIEYTASVQNLDALGNLTSIGGSLVLIGNDGLTNVDGLSQLTQIGQNLMIRGNNLSDINGFSQLTSIPGELDLYGNPFSNIDGLSQLTSVGSNLLIKQNNLLTNLDALSQLTSVSGDLKIEWENNLQNLDGLSQLTTVGGDLSIIANNSLSQCCGICALFEADIANPTVIGGSITLGNNLTGCNSIVEINACNSCVLIGTSDIEERNIQLRIFPNPAQDLLKFQFDSPKNEVYSFTIQNQLGQELLRRQFTSNLVESVEITELAVGMYLLSVWDGKKSTSQRFSLTR